MKTNPVLETSAKPTGTFQLHTVPTPTKAKEEKKALNSNSALLKTQKDPATVPLKTESKSTTLPPKAQPPLLSAKIVG